MSRAIEVFEPSAVLGSPAMFDGVTLRLYNVELLIVLVRQEILLDPYESSLLVVAFAARFDRTIVLVARDASGIPTYYGPEAIARALAGLPFDALTWKRYRFRNVAPPKLPIPRDVDDGTDQTDSQPSWSTCDPPDTELRETTIRIGAITRGLRPRPS
ncbi:MAG: hypothetical protein ABI867_27955 [Kofleriaceae bacterium]